MYNSIPTDEGDLKDFLPQDLLHDDLGIMNILSDDFKEPAGEFCLKNIFSQSFEQHIEHVCVKFMLFLPLNGGMDMQILRTVLNLIMHNEWC